MEERGILDEKEQKKIISKLEKKLFSGTRKNKKSKKSVKKERENEKIKKEKKEIFENNTSKSKKNKHSKDSINNNIIKNEKYIVNKFIKFEKTNEKQNDIECQGINNKNQNIYEKSETNSEKGEILKISQISTTNIRIRFKDEKAFKYSKNGKTKERKNERKYKSEEDISQEKNNKQVHEKKYKNFNKKEKYENMYNEYSDNGKKEKNYKKYKRLILKKKKEKIQINIKRIERKDEDKKNIYTYRNYSKFDEII